MIASRSSVRRNAAVHDPRVLTGTQDVGPFAPYRVLARAVLLQAVKDCTKRTRGPNGVVRYRDISREGHAALSARRFLSRPSDELSFWCFWLHIHPDSILQGMRRMAIHDHWLWRSETVH